MGRSYGASWGNRACLGEIREGLIGAATMCLQQDVSPRAIALATAAAILYHNPEDPAAQSLQALRREHGLAAVLEQVCRVSPEAPLARHITEEVEALQREFGLP